MTLKQVKSAFTWTQRRDDLYRGLVAAAMNMIAAGVPAIWIDGSFTTAKDEPEDIDGCWEYVESVNVDRLDPVFLELDPPRRAMREKYGVDFLITNMRLRDAGGATVQQFFQVDRDGNARGVVRIDLTKEATPPTRGTRGPENGHLTGPLSE
jgi:hypothetical protein